MSLGNQGLGAAIMGGSRGLSNSIGNRMASHNIVMATAINNHYQALQTQLHHENHLSTIEELHKKGLLTQGARIQSAGGHGFVVGKPAKQSEGEGTEPSEQPKAIEAATSAPRRKTTKPKSSPSVKSPFKTPEQGRVELESKLAEAAKPVPNRARRTAAK
jgi:hypothetical protein